MIFPHALARPKYMYAETNHSVLLVLAIFGLIFFLTREDFIILFKAAWALTNIVVIDHVFCMINNKIQAIIEAGFLAIAIHLCNFSDDLASKSEITGTNIQMIGSLRYLCLKLYHYAFLHALYTLYSVEREYPEQKAFVVVTLYAFFLFAIIPHCHSDILPCIFEARAHTYYYLMMISLHGTSMRMNHFVINFQYYIMFEIIAESDIVLPSLL
ncbi:hypothetical protein ACJX0J_010813 [Zea mays]